LNLQEIIKKIDNIRGAIDIAFETGKIDFDRISSDLAVIVDSLAETLPKGNISDNGEKPKKPGNQVTVPREVKIEDYN
jgi:hypothetical protein